MTKKFQKICAICGAEFEGVCNVKYCSKECYKKARIKQNSEAAKKKRRNLKLCGSFGNGFIVGNNSKSCKIREKLFEENGIEYEKKLRKDGDLDKEQFMTKIYMRLYLLGF